MRALINQLDSELHLPDSDTVIFVATFPNHPIEPRYPVNPFGGSVLKGDTEIRSVPTPPNSSYREDVDPFKIAPTYLDFGPHEFDFEPLLDRKLHISFGFIQDEDGEIVVNKEATKHSLSFGWHQPSDLLLSKKLSSYLLKCGSFFDWGDYQDSNFGIQVEITAVDLPIPEDKKSPYDEVLHTDLNNSGFPVAQVFWANLAHSEFSLDEAYIGDGHEVLQVELGEPTNVCYTISKKGRHSPIISQFYDGQLVVADAKSLPHRRPDLSKVRKKRFQRKQTRYFLRAFISPIEAYSTDSGLPMTERIKQFSTIPGFKPPPTYQRGLGQTQS